jgi:hypothetical protein
MKTVDYQVLNFELKNKGLLKKDKTRTMLKSGEVQFGKFSQNETYMAS